MNGDFSRFTFDPKKNYNSVLLQQGRVILDADWNEQGDIQKHIRETEALDVVGRCGAPIDIAGFKVGVAPDGRDLTLSSGRMYVDGKLCELDEGDQSDAQPIVDDEGPGTYLAYLDVWDRHITAVEDDEIREKALDGPDTATRVKTEWLVKLKQCDLDPENVSCREASLELKKQIDPDDSRLAVRLQPPQKESATDPCEVLSGTAYRGLENQLYRVEIHEPGVVGKATFKWSRNNGAVAFAVVDFIEDESEDEGSEIAGTSNEYHKVKLKQLGWDQELRIHKDDWVEVLGDETELLGLPGTLARVEDIDEADLILTLTADVAKHSNESNPKVRRWDLNESGLEESQLIKGIPTATDFEDETDSENGGWIELEDGIEVSFKAGDIYRTGDFWLIPARNTGEIEWPHEESDFVPKFGIHHHNCLLAILSNLEGTWNIQKDCRKLFPPLTDMVFLFYAGGEGQEGMPGEELPAPLQVRVQRGGRPVEGAEVEFEIVKGNGKIRDKPDGDYVDGPITVTTDDDGIAQCLWKFGDDRPGNDLIWTEQVEATLIKPGQEHPPSMLFGATAVPLSLSYVGGDGQEAMPGDCLPAPFQVRVSRGECPVEGAEIEFEIFEGEGVLDPDEGSVLTGTDGIAQCACKFKDNLESFSLRVRATLIDVLCPDENGDRFHPSIIFNANASVAEQVAYSQPEECIQLGGVETVKDAINGLCRQVSFSYVGGDGQETMPGYELPGPFRVRVARGSYPVKGAKVNFKIDGEKGKLREVSGGTDEVELDLSTDENGIATCFCKLDENAVIVAKLTEPTPTDQSPIRFYANVSVAEEVAYSPPEDCLQLDGVETVRDAINGLCRQVSFTPVGGDGQETMPGNELPGPFRVRVARGSYPVREAMVQFKIEPEKGELRKDSGETGEELDVPTDDDGIATCFCKLDENATIEAKLTSPTPTDQSPIIFNANISVAEEVAYSPPGDCLQLDGVETVRDAVNGLCRQVSFTSVGGDGQETMPGNELPGPFRVRVARGTYPVKEAMVQFKIENGKGELRKGNGGTGEELNVSTDDDGIATCFCSRLDENATIEAKLTSPTPTDQSPIRFYANVSVAARVAYDPASCPRLSQARTVQAAIDGLCRIIPVEASRLIEASRPAEASRVVWVHGNSLQVERLEGEISVIRENYGTVVEVTSGSKAWIHFSIPSTQDLNGNLPVARMALIRLKASVKDSIMSVSIHDGERQIYSNAKISASETWGTIEMGPIDKPISTGLGISILVDNVEDARRIMFSAAGCQFLAE